MSAHVTIVFRFMNLRSRLVLMVRMLKTVCAAIDDLAEEQLHDLDRIEVQHDDQFLMKL